MKQKHLLIIIFAVVVICIVVFMCCYKKEKEYMSGGFDVTSGLGYYNQNMRCADGNLLGSSSPYCESQGYILQ